MTYRAAAGVDEWERQAVDRLPNRHPAKIQVFPSAKTAYASKFDAGSRGW